MADENIPQADPAPLDLRPKKGKPADEPKTEPTSADAPGARIVEERIVRENEDLPALRKEAVEAAAKRALAAGLTSFTCEYTETGPTTFQVEAKRIG